MGDASALEYSTANSPSSNLSELSEVIDRDLSWLNFNRRVLHEAVDERTPLLERVMFLGIFTSNLDEFFMLLTPWVDRSIRFSIDAERVRRLSSSLEETQAGSLRHENRVSSYERRLSYFTSFLTRMFFQSTVPLTSF
jgi:polyphosphate kinase